MTRWAALTRGQLVLALRLVGHVACVRWLMCSRDVACVARRELKRANASVPRVLPDAPDEHARRGARPHPSCCCVLWYNVVRCVPRSSGPAGFLCRARQPCRVRPNIRIPERVLNGYPHARLSARRRGSGYEVQVRCPRGAGFIHYISLP